MARPKIIAMSQTMQDNLCRRMQITRLQDARNATDASAIVNRPVPICRVNTGDTVSCGGRYGASQVGTIERTEYDDEANVWRVTVRLRDGNTTSYLQAHVRVIRKAPAAIVVAQTTAIVLYSGGCVTSKRVPANVARCNSNTIQHANVI